jgi:hypothetical protein
MDGFRPETYGDRIADVYDALMVNLSDPADCVDRLAGLRLRERWGGWRREPFGAGSGLHVSVYEHAGVATS